MKKGEAKERELDSDELEIPPPPQTMSMSSDLPSFQGPKLNGSYSSVQPLKPLDMASTSQPRSYRQLDEESVLDTLPDLKPFDFGQDESAAMTARPLKENVMPKANASEVQTYFPSNFPAKEQQQPVQQPTWFAEKPAQLLPKPVTPNSNLEIAAPATSSTFLIEKPAFISAYKYRQIMEDIDSIIGRKEIMSELSILNESEEREYEKWSKCLEDTQRMIMDTDKTLFEV